MSSPIKTYPTKNTGVGSHAEVTGTDVSGAKRALDVAVKEGTIDVSGEVIIAGLKTACKVTTMNVTDTATPLPATALTGRNSLSLVNLDNVETLYVGPATITADRVVGVTSGWEINPLEGFNIDIQDDIVIYGRAETGKTILVKIIELA